MGSGAKQANNTATIRQKKKHEPYTNSTEQPKGSLAQQYGGLHTGKWVGKLPPSWIPYVQLARLSPPAGVFLVFFPHFFGLVHASILRQVSLLGAEGLRACGLMAAGSFFLSNAIHGWNDLVDAPIDRLVSRTISRPIVRGAVSPRGALLFTVSQALAGLALLPALPSGTTLAVVPSLAANIYYPFSKRHTHLTQFVLGISLAWGVVVGTTAYGVDLWEHGTLAPTACLFAASMLWTVIYDTIYAFQDIQDDLRIGVKSTAVLFGRSWAKPFLWVCLAFLFGLVCSHGYLLQVGWSYYLLAGGGCLVSLGTMIVNVNLGAPGSCWWWFRYGFWLAGWSIAGGLLSLAML